MAVLTDVSRIDMCRIPAFGSRAIVATGTVSDDVGVIESSRQPGVRAMTGLTLVTALRVIDRLSRPGNTIVTTATTADNLSVVNAANGAPGRLQMTVLTQAGTENMIGGHRCRFYESGPCMAAAAFARRSLKNSADMTSLAIRVPVRSL